jgi:hypothetical protein
MSISSLIGRSGLRTLISMPSSSTADRRIRASRAAQVNVLRAVGGRGELIFNIVSGSNPQGPGAYSVAGAGGTERLAIADAGIFKNNVSAVFGHSSAPVPFAVTIE